MSDCPLCHPQAEYILLENQQVRIIAVTDQPDTPAYCRVIWQQHVAEMTDLSPQERSQLMQWVCRTEAALCEVLHPTKINLASLGNWVPHLHWHVIARFEDDSHFPDPIWAAPKRAATLSLPENWLQRVQQQLLAACPVPLSSDS